MRVGAQVKYWMRVVSSALLVHITSASGQTVEIPLGTPDGFRADAIDSIGNDRYCISGHVYDDTGPSRAAMVVLLDANSRRVLWRTPIPYGAGYVSNSAVACGTDSRSVYVVTEDNTQRSESLNQTRVVVNRISAAGKLEKRQPIYVGFDEWSYMLDVGPAGVNVAGGTSATLQRGGPFGTFLVHLDADLGQAKLMHLASGAFWTEATARFKGQDLVVAGKFLPNAGAGRDGFAVSQIDLGGKRYVWSAYPLPGNVTSAKAFVSSDGSVYDAAITPTGVLTVALLDPAGKVTSTFSTGDGTVCGIDTVSANRRTLRLIGDSCKGNHSTLLSVDLVSHTVSTVHSFGNELDAAGFDRDNWISVTKSDTHGALFQRGAN